MTDPAAILFDMDDTILDDTGSAAQCWKMACETYAPALGTVTPAALFEAIERYRKWYWDDAERHRLGRLQMVETRRHIVTTALERLGFDAPEIAQQIAAMHDTLREEILAPFPGAIDVLRQVRERGIRMALITNGTGIRQRRKIERFGLAQYFDPIVIEGEFGVGKPDPSVYNHALAQLNVTPQETWMVGDNLEWDVAAPQRLGIFGIWVDLSGQGLPTGATTQPDRIIRAITELF